METKRCPLGADFNPKFICSYFDLSINKLLKVSGKRAFFGYLDAGQDIPSLTIISLYG